MTFEKLENCDCTTNFARNWTASAHIHTHTHTNRSNKTMGKCENSQSDSQSVNNEYLSMCLVKLIKKTAVTTADMAKRKWRRQNPNQAEKEKTVKRNSKSKKEKIKRHQTGKLTRSVRLLLKCATETKECMRPCFSLSLSCHHRVLSPILKSAAAVAVIKLARRRQANDFEAKKQQKHWGNSLSAWPVSWWWTRLEKKKIK